MIQNYEDRVRLLISVLALVDWQDAFALKGGTALNLFNENMPRFSVDIDLVYLPLNSREEALVDIKSRFERMKDKLSGAGYKVQVGKEYKLMVSKGINSVKIEANIVIRGSLYPPEIKALVKSARTRFEQHVEAPCLSHKELIGSKLVAMVDRQHPRDIFDMMKYLETNLSLENIREPFIAYLMQSKRPFSELLNPNILDIANIFNEEFKGMSVEDVSLEELHNCRGRILTNLPKLLGKECKELFVSILEQKPKWELLPYPNLKNYPGIAWKVKNIKEMSPDKVREEIQKVELSFGLKQTINDDKMNLGLRRRMSR